MKSIFKLLISLTACFLLIGVCPAAPASAATDEYSLWIGDTRVTSDNCNKLTENHWSYNPATHTLTLENLKLSGIGHCYAGDYSSTIYYEGSDDLIINLKGNNVITQSKEHTGNYDYAIMSAKEKRSITFTGSGSIYLKMTDTWSGAPLYSAGSVIINSGTLVSTGGYSGIEATDVIIKKGITAVEATGLKNTGVAITGNMINEISGTGYYANGNTTKIPADTVGGLVSFKSVKFSTKPRTFSVVFEPNGGSGSMNPVEVKEDEEYLIPECGFEAPDGKIFYYWEISGVDRTVFPGNTEPMVSHIAKDGEIRFTATWRTVPRASILTAPEGNDCTYSGTDIELVTAGVPQGGSMQYALGTDDKTAPASGWSKEIPTAADAGTYYVWYRVLGEKDRSNSEKVCVTVTIAKRDVTVKANDQTIKETESPELTSANADLTGAVSDHALTAVTITEKEGKLIPSGATIKDSKNNDVTANYNITYDQGTLTVLQKISCKVTFNVENGEWNNGGKDAIEVELTGFEGDTLKLQPDQIPGVGSKPAANHKQGSWDVTPDTETAITKDTAYVYTYVEVPVYTVTVEGDNYTPGSGQNIVFTVKRSFADDSTFDCFDKVTVDGNTVSDKYYQTARGSLILTLSSEYLDTLSAGSHNIKITFTDGEAQVSVTIKNKPSPVPATGESSSPFVCIAMLLLGGALVLFVAAIAPKTSRRKARPAHLIQGQTTKDE